MRVANGTRADLLQGKTDRKDGSKEGDFSQKPGHPARRGRPELGHRPAERPPILGEGGVATAGLNQPGAKGESLEWKRKGGFSYLPLGYNRYGEFW